MKLKPNLSFILPECILIVCLILDLISKERDTFTLYFISLLGLLISMAYYYSNGMINLLLIFQAIFKLTVLIEFFNYL
jgi:hypothetical protein